MMSTYKKLCTSYYDLEDHKDHGRALAFYLEQARQAHGAILEPMCGTGRFLIPILTAGYSVEGFDASADMLAALQQNYAPITTVQAPVWQQYVHELKRDKKYNLIFIPYGSFGLILDKEIAQQSLKKLYKHLERGGKLFLEIETVSSAPQACGVKNRSVKQAKNNQLLVLTTRLNYHQETQLFTAYCRYELLEAGKVIETEDEDFAMHLYRSDELDLLLQEAGFTCITKYTDYDRSTYKLDQAALIIYECTK